MRRFGTDYPYLIDNPAEGVWLVRFDIRRNHGEYGALAYGTNYEEARFDHKPTLQEIRNAIAFYYESEAEQLIRSGYRWKNVAVWLSDTNQRDYADQFLLSAVSEGGNLPYTVKGGTEEDPVYFDLSTTAEMEQFYTGMLAHIREAREACWYKKGDVDYALYDNYLNLFEEMTDLEKTKMEQSSKVLQAMDSRRSFRLDGKEVWCTPYERGLLYERVRRGEPIRMGETDLSPKVGTKVLDTMAGYADCIAAVQQEKQERIRLAKSVLEVQQVDPEEGYPDVPSLQVDTVQTELEQEARRDPQVQAVAFARLVINTAQLPPQKALEMQVLYPVWGETDAEFGKEVDTGFRLRVVEGDSEKLWEVVQKHTISAEWKPGVETMSLYKAVEPEHVGTEEDPIPWRQGMELVNGKFYVDKDVLYECIRDSGQAMAYDLSDLVSGGYVQVVEKGGGL